MLNWQRHVPFAFDRQLLLADLIGDLRGLTTCKPASFPLAVASHGKRKSSAPSLKRQAWLWSWANEASNIPEQQQATSLKLKALGEEHGIAELTESIVLLDHADGHAFASIAVGEGLGKAYYRGSYEGGAAFLLITDDELQLQVDDPLQRILAVFPQAIAAMETADHREAIRGHLEHYGFKPDDEGDALILRQQGQEVLRAEPSRAGSRLPSSVVGVHVCRIIDGHLFPAGRFSSPS